MTDVLTQALTSVDAHWREHPTYEMEALILPVVDAKTLGYWTPVAFAALLRHCAKDDFFRSFRVTTADTYDCFVGPVRWSFDSQGTFLEAMTKTLQHRQEMRFSSAALCGIRLNIKDEKVILGTKLDMAQISHVRQKQRTSYARSDVTLDLTVIRNGEGKIIGHEVEVERRHDESATVAMYGAVIRQLVGVGEKVQALTKKTRLNKRDPIYV